MNQTYEEYLLDKIDIIIDNEIKLRRKNETFQTKKKIQKKINHL